MSSPISLSNFNSIDFSMILNAVMAQNSQPLTALQNKQADLQTEYTSYNALATKLGSLESAAAGLSTSNGVTSYASTLSDSSSIAVSTTADAIAGTYDVVVNTLAKAQVSASSSTAADADTSSVGSSGTLGITVGGVTTNITVTSAVTLKSLATQINATANVPVTASVVQSAPGEYRLVLTSKETGLANGFTVTGNLIGGSGTSFTDPTAQEAMDADVTVNGVKIKSSSNTLTSAIPGATLSLLHANTVADPTKSTTVTVAADNSGLTKSVQSFVSAYNDVIAFISDQKSQAANGATGTLAHEALIGQARDALRTALGGAYGSGTFSHLAEIGIGFNRTGQLTFDTAAFSSALTQDRSSVVALFTGTDTNSSGFTNGVFGSVQAALDDFTRTGGFVKTAQGTVAAQGTRLDTQINDMQARLAIQRTTLQAQFTAADQAMTQLKSQSGTLANLTSGLSTN